MVQKRVDTQVSLVFLMQNFNIVQQFMIDIRICTI